MKQRVLSYDGRSVTELALDAPGPIRWVARSEEDGDILVGDKGAVFRHGRGGFVRLSSPTSQNLRCVAFSPRGGTAYACGNHGTVLRIDGHDVKTAGLEIRDSLRRLAWDAAGRTLLMVGNGGAAYTLDGHGKLARVYGADTHLRSVSWHPKTELAVVTGNCFRDTGSGLTPSPNLFVLEGGTLREVSSLEESKADLTSSSWHPDGSSCLLLGFDQTWHTPAIFSYAGGLVESVHWEGKELFPTACAWEPGGKYALLGTSRMTPEEGDAALYRYDAGGVSRLQDLNGLGVSCICWGSDGRALIACSRSNRAFTS